MNRSGRLRSLDDQWELRQAWKKLYRAWNESFDPKVRARMSAQELAAVVQPDWTPFTGLTCGARSKHAGRPCRIKALCAGGRCRFHGGLSTGPGRKPKAQPSSVLE